jgi:hypothetical protein
LFITGRESTVSKSVFIRSLGAAVLVVAIGALFWFATRHGHPAEEQVATPEVLPPPIPTNPAPPTPVVPPPTLVSNTIVSQPPPVNPAPPPGPFDVVRTNGPYKWTAGDGTDTNVIRQLAHNDLEYQRMVIENPTIYRRQLVYHTEPFMQQAEQAVQSGQSIQQITLPGLDGQLLTANVTRMDLKDGGAQGQLYGQLPGDPNSIVTVAFVNGPEAFTVISAQDQIDLQGEAHDPGMIVVKSVNPATYGRVPR